MSILKDIQQQVADQLSAQTLFANIAVLVENKMDIQNQVAQALGPLTETGGKNGAYIFVTTPTANAEFGNVGSTYFSKVKIRILVEEQVSVNNGVNGTTVSALNIAEEICKALNQFYPATATSPLIPDSPTIEEVPNAPDFNSYYVNFICMGTASASSMSIAGTPAFSDPGGNSPKAIGITSSTAGAAIFFTTDGSNPSPRNGTLVTGGIASLNSGTNIKARAFLAGYFTSQIATYTVS